MKRVLLMLALLGLFASPALAINPSLGTNSFGIFFDQTADSNCKNDQATYTPMNAYILAVHPSQSAGISGWEAFVFINPTTFPAGITFDIGPEALNVFTAPSFQTGFAVSRNGDPILLCTITTFYLGGPIYFGIGPGYPSSFNLGDPFTNGYAPGYADGNDAGILVPFVTDSNTTPWTMPYMAEGGINAGMPMTYAFLVATLNAGSCVTATEKSTWGGVKDLYK